MFLPDVNLWLALTFDSHVHHPDAKNWFDGLSDDICVFCRMTQQGFLRLSTNPRAFGQHALTLRQAWHEYDAFQSDPRVSYADEPANLETHWRNWTRQQSFSPHVWNDAYLAAFALSASLQMVTFDQAFAQYHGVKCVFLP
ncbi:MAG TPA: TA system VapC family ribonuclease toxin [Pirellulales bacterium]|nr:TA system VapC family ribonuclease toxin [Pirellulales bacterium]